MEVGKVGWNTFSCSLVSCQSDLPTMAVSIWTVLFFCHEPHLKHFASVTPLNDGICIRGNSVTVRTFGIVFDLWTKRRRVALRSVAKQIAVHILLFYRTFNYVGGGTVFVVCSNFVIISQIDRAVSLRIPALSL